MPARAHEHALDYEDASGNPHAAVVRIERCDCRLAGHDWAFARKAAARIDRDWANAIARNPAYFDGIVLLTSSYRLDGTCPRLSGTAPGVCEGGILRMTLFETRFRNYLAWRHDGYADTGVIDGFGSAVVHAADGAILLVRQHAGNVNEGLHYFPSGFIDTRDVDASGAVDIAASVVREMAEEVGIGLDDVTRRPGFVLTRAGPHLSIGVEFDSALPAEALARRIRRYLEHTSDPEIADVAFVRSKADLTRLDLAPHCAVLLDHLF